MNAKIALRSLLWLSSGLVLFHLSILLKIIPYEITWGGRLQNDAEMYAFESFSLCVNLFLILILMIKGGHLKPIIPEKIVNLILWLYLVLFAFNTIGNILAKTNFEKIFTLLTFSFCISLWIILRKGKELANRRN